MTEEEEAYYWRREQEREQERRNEESFWDQYWLDNYEPPDPFEEAIREVLERQTDDTNRVP